MKCQCGGEFEFALARNVQQLLFPKSSPSCHWCCFGVKNHMANGVGGDFFEFLTLPDGSQSVFLGDVTGHGLHASVVMSLLYGFIHRACLKSCVPLEAVLETNEFLQSFAERSQKYDHFFSSTLFFGSIHPETLEMHYINCGHLPPMVRRGDQLFTLNSTGPPIGFFDHPDIEMRSFRFEKDDRLLLYTDGISEAVNAEGVMFGLRRLSQLLMTSDLNYLEFLDEIFAELKRFGACNPPQDDCTAIVIDFHPFMAPMSKPENLPE
ncbi:serine phosphatase [Geoalkalibacter ferrihydriticus]|uniref:Serine/threonine protein phosphatase n=2 Tax=Geoalkalibacter ferrihydriticus TaxID=392333 RepID=A0A0C2HGM5_9BACT|nr:PP2C family protein-serine/threonine phosphatase [Geoalkalibacter ferrihydriticus]KIH76096.1 serine/threonine protein phosphatase [Geoalkalibacter ferrihydriticus DSM 17813]SDM45777.1 serine phosphatase [Geoalkalibacter ferrihydriticus]